MRRHDGYDLTQELFITSMCINLLFGVAFRFEYNKDMQIDSLEKWNKASSWLTEHGFSRYLIQYAWNEPTGFHASFINCEDHTYLKVISYDEAVQKAIVVFGYQPKKR